MVSPNVRLSSFQGAAFGFNVIAAKAGEQLAPFLPQLLPRLYRYQFDPNLGIRQAMTSIWNALVTDKSMVSCCKQQWWVPTNLGVFQRSLWESCVLRNEEVCKKELDIVLKKDVVEPKDEVRNAQRLCASSCL